MSFNNDIKLSPSIVNPPLSSSPVQTVKSQDSVSDITSTQATAAIKETSVSHLNKPDRTTATIKSDSLSTNVNETKKNERAALFETYKSAMNKDPNFPTDDAVIKTSIEKSLQKPATSKLLSAIQNETKESLTSEQIKKITSLSVKGEIDSPELLIDIAKQANVTISPESAKTILKKMKNETVDKAKTEKESAKLANTTIKLRNLLNNPLEPHETQSERNKAVLSTLREAFQSPAYQQLKEDESNPVIRLLHDVNLAGYLETPLLDAYEPMSEAMLGKEKSDQLENMDGKQLTTTLTEVRNDAGKRGIFKSDKCFAFFKKHYRIAYGAFQSTKYGKGYDPRGSLENASGAFYEKQIKVGDKQAKVTTVYTPSPTIDNKVSPEFRAALQAMQNSKLEMNGAPDDRPKIYLYTNLQNINGGESYRSVAIMKMNEEFPHVARFKTLTKDSAFYKEGLDHHANWNKVEKPSPDSTYFQGVVENLIKANQTDNQFSPKVSDKQREVLCKAFNTGSTFEERVENLNKQLIKEGFKLTPEKCAECLSLNTDHFFKKFEDQLKDDANFSLENRTKDKGGGFYFPGGKDKWEAPIDDILAKAKVYTEEKAAKMEKPITGRDAWELQAFAKEFVYTSLQRYDEAEAAKENGVDHIVVTSACKENIDRGGCETAKSLWLMGKQHIKEAVAGYFTRPIAAKFRIILEDRVQPFHAVLKITDNNPEEFEARSLPNDSSTVENSVRTIRKGK